MTLRVAELEVLFTANTDQVAKAEKGVKASGERIEKNPIKVDADAKGALESMARVEGAAKKIVSQKTLATVDANIDRAEKSFMKVKERLDYLRSVETDLEVTADVKRAHANLERVTRSLEGLRNARAVMEVDADTSAAETALDGAADAAGESGAEAGDEFGKNIVAALIAIPIAGAVIGVGVAAGKALIDGVQQGLAVEVRSDRLAALAGLSDEDAARIGRGAGEAYANVFGESIESNMDTARLGVQFDLIDDKATARAAQRTVESLAGMADVIESDAKEVASTVAVMLNNGIAKNAEEAFDVLATGVREGVNRNEDLLETFGEFSPLFKRLGLDSKDALGLLSQGLKAGARDSNFVADALKEFQIRATDASESSAQAFQDLGFDAADMTSKIARGGEEARAGLEEVLDALRNTEDPVNRNAAAIALFGTKAEDLGDSLFALDVSNAVDNLGQVTGAAQRMFDTLSDNDGTRVEQAQRNIETAVTGIQGALAQVFSEPLGDFSDWVSQNRGPLLQFFRDLALGAVDFAETATDSFGGFVSGPLADIVSGVGMVIKSMNPFADTSDLDAFVEGMRGMEEQTALLGEGYDAIREKIRGAMDPQIAQGFVNDAGLATASAIDAIGEAAEGATPKLEEQVNAAMAALEAELQAAVVAGESQADLEQRYKAGTEAIIGQATEMGLQGDEARLLTEAYGLIPAEVETKVTADASEAKATIQETWDMLMSLGDGGSANRDNAWVVRMEEAGRAVAANRPKSTRGGMTMQALGSVLMPMADGGTLSPMSKVAQSVPPNTWRVVGDRMDVPESYIPHDGSARSLAILQETMRAFGIMPMADGGILGAGGSVGGFNWNGDLVVDGGDTSSPVDLARLIRREFETLMREQFGNRGGL